MDRDGEKNMQDILYLKLGFESRRMRELCQQLPRDIVDDRHLGRETSLVCVCVQRNGHTHIHTIYIYILRWDVRVRMRERLHSTHLLQYYFKHTVSLCMPMANSWLDGDQDTVLRREIEGLSTPVHKYIPLPLAPTEKRAQWKESKAPLVQ